MDHMKSLGVIKPWMSLIWHNVVKIGVVEKAANFDANFEGEGVEIPENGADLYGKRRIWTFRISNQIFRTLYG